MPKKKAPAKKEYSDETKLAQIRKAMAEEDWEQAIKIAGKFQRLGAQGDAIKTARDALMNRKFYEQIGHNIEQLVEAGVAALKERYSGSWDSVRKKDE